MTGPLKIDLSQQSRLLLNGVPVVTKMFPSNNSYQFVEYRHSSTLSEGS